MRYYKYASRWAGSFMIWHHLHSHVPSSIFFFCSSRSSSTTYVLHTKPHANCLFSLKPVRLQFNYDLARTLPFRQWPRTIKRQRLHVSLETEGIFCECQTLDCWTWANGWFPFPILKAEQWAFVYVSMPGTEKEQNHLDVTRYEQYTGVSGTGSLRCHRVMRCKLRPLAVSDLSDWM